MENLNEKLYMKFPAILRDKLKNGEIKFSEKVLFEYEPILAYRGIERKVNDNTPISIGDFQSYASQGRCLKRGQITKQNEIEYYGVSLFKKKECVENALRFPRPNKKIAVGYVIKENGPQETNKETEHICWWLFENANVSNFHICEDGKE